MLVYALGGIGLSEAQKMLEDASVSPTVLGHSRMGIQEILPLYHDRVTDVDSLCE